MSLHERIQAAQIDSSRAAHEQSWEAEAVARNQGRNFRDRLIGKGTVEAADVRLKQAHKDNQIISTRADSSPEHK